METYAIFRFSQKTGKVDATLTCGALALAKLWALQNTTASKATVVIDVETHFVVFTVKGKKDSFPVVKELKSKRCEDIGITEEVLQSVVEYK